MIKAYLAWIPSYYEGEDIETRYAIFKDGELIEEESEVGDYCKPGICGLKAVGKLLETLEEYKEEEILIIINDGAVYELLNGSSMTNKRDIQQMASEVRMEMDRFSNLEVENVSGDHLEIEKWDEILKG